MRSELVLSLGGEKVDAGNSAALANKLSQMANGAVYGENKKLLPLHDRKLDALEDLIEAANGKARPGGLLVQARSGAHPRPVYRPGNQDRPGHCRLEPGENPGAVIHPASADHGLNLQAGGSTLIWFGLTWSLELYQQTNARLWRQGQKAQTVVIHHIITKDTIDERIMSAIRRKDKTQSALIDAVKANLEV